MKSGLRPFTLLVIFIILLTASCANEYSLSSPQYGEASGDVRIINICPMGSSAQEKDPICRRELVKISADRGIQIIKINTVYRGKYMVAAEVYYKIRR